MLDVELLDALPTDGLLTAWRDLATVAENPFASPEWMAACLEVEPALRPLIIVCRSEDGTLVGIVPLVTERRGPLRPPAETYADWFGPACAPEQEVAVAVAVISALQREGRLGRRLTMTRCLTGAGWLVGVRHAQPSQHTLIATAPVIELPLVRFSRPPAMSRKQRREIARLLRRLNDEHDVEFLCAMTRQDAEAAFPAFERLHRQRWPDQYSEATAPFHRNFAMRAADQGWLRIWTLAIDGEPAAVLYGFKVGARSFAYMQAFDADWSRYGVGILLFDHAIHASEAEGSDVFDMLRGQERYKGRFENDVRTARTFDLVGRGSYARLAIHSRRAAKRALMKLPDRHQTMIRRLLRRN